MGSWIFRHGCCNLDVRECVRVKQTATRAVFEGDLMRRRGLVQRRAGRGRRPGVEGLESRRLMAVTYSLYPIDPGSQPNSITVGSDNRLWFTVPNFRRSPPDEIGAIDPRSGVVSYYPTPYPGSLTLSIVSGPNGDLWFIDDIGTFNVASISPTTHAVTEFPVRIPGASLRSLAAGSDGHLWFTDVGNDAIGELDPTTGFVTEFPLPDAHDIPNHIAAGPGGELWFTLFDHAANAPAIGDINPTTHAITITDIPKGGPPAEAIAAGPDGNVWFTQVGGSVGMGFSLQIGSISPTTHAVRTTPGAGTGGITAGPDGRVWFNATTGWIDPNTFVINTYTDFDTGVLPDFRDIGEPTIVTGPDGNLWQVGQGYLVAVSIVPPTQAAIAGLLFLDTAGVGWDLYPLPGQTVFLDLKGDGKVDPGDPTANTNVLGYYAFRGLAPGTYTVRVASYPGNITTFPATGSRTVTVSAGQRGMADDLGMIPGSSLFPLPYNPSPFGTHSPDVETAEVTAVYNLVLGHAPDAAGLAYWVKNLKNGVPISTLSNYLLTSAEYDTDLVLADYRNFLRVANPSVAAVNQWVGFMQAGLTAKQVASYFMTCDVFNNLYPSDAAFVQALYVDVLGYQPASWEVASWLTVLHGGATRSQAVRSFLDSSFAAERIVRGMYGTILSQSVDSNTLMTEVESLQVVWTPAQFATSLFGTPLFAVRAYDSRL